MLGKKFRVLGIICLVLWNHSSFATKEPKKCEYSDWHCRDTFYLSTGFQFNHLLFSNHNITLLPNYVTQPSKAFPNNFFGVRFGFGNHIRNHRRYTYEVNYAQLFPATKTHNGVTVSRTSKALAGSLSYSLNPGSRLEGKLVAGATIDSGSNHVKGVVNGIYNSTNITFTDVFPNLGVSGTYHINSKFSIKLTELYQIIHYNKNANAAFVSQITLHYYPL